ncbi:MAG TPA: hypothetical protein PKK95_16390, partial [Vicinamibacterales bacterium]|nr:hypothetical protein [Vicinamibacterales bacterium]
MRNPHRPASPYGRVWTWPDQEIAAASERAAAWLPPTLTIDSRSHLVALWALEEPLRVGVQDVAARRLFDRVAERVGAVPLEQVARLDIVKTPGSIR